MKQTNEFQSVQPKTIVITSVETLKAAFQQWADEREQTRNAEREDAMIDEAEVIKRLGKSRATLWRWNNSGYLVCHKFGGKNCYRLSDVERIEKGKP
ncbi:MAG: hypothetical protein NC344_01205 [Bacteroidales bacterium]|nr:hypothetical protein [Bacteroidales bacterium]MCM1146454.1 hypothetical protein [Bacteroidales bacterium]MCM1205108.1 hypothetical protein [Bacillota bacterium]MCM1509354.1 hypothetical protein [Clostridium sp.]